MCIDELKLETEKAQLRIIRFVRITAKCSRGWLESSSFIHSGYIYSASSSPQLLSGAPDPERILHQSFTPEVPQATASKGLAQGPLRGS